MSLSSKHLNYFPVEMNLLLIYTNHLIATTVCFLQYWVWGDVVCPCLGDKNEKKDTQIDVRDI